MSLLVWLAECQQSKHADVSCVLWLLYDRMGVKSQICRRGLVRAGIWWRGQIQHGTLCHRLHVARGTDIISNAHVHPKYNRVGSLNIFSDSSTTSQYTTYSLHFKFTRSICTLLSSCLLQLEQVVAKYLTELCMFLTSPCTVPCHREFRLHISNKVNPIPPLEVHDYC